MSAIQDELQQLEGSFTRSLHPGGDTPIKAVVLMQGILCKGLAAPPCKNWRCIHSVCIGCQAGLPTVHKSSSKASRWVGCAEQARSGPCMQGLWQPKLTKGRHLPCGVLACVGERILKEVGDIFDALLPHGLLQVLHLQKVSLQHST